MNHETVRKIIKMGELKAILNNVDDNGRINNNCIALAKNDCVLLRTNGVVIYGLYDESNQGNFGHRNKNLIQFTHDMTKDNPYVNTNDYAKYKPIVLKAYRDIFNEAAKQKYEAVRYIILNHKWYKDKLKEVQESNNKIEEPKQEQKIEIKKEVKEMNKDLNIMQLAHLIRKELGLEGDYRAQMKMAMTYAWKVKKGITSLEVILGDSSSEATAPTYNVANLIKDDNVVNKDKPLQHTDEAEHELKLHEVSKGLFKLGLTDLSTGDTKYFKADINSLNTAAAYLYVGKNIESIVKQLPNKTRIVAMPVTITACKTRPGLKDVCASKGLIYQEFKAKNIFDNIKTSAPSGEAV